MIQIKDIFISIKDIKYIKHTERYGYDRLNIKYMFNDEEVSIEVDDYEEYIKLANEIKDAVNERERNENNS